MDSGKSEEENNEVSVRLRDTTENQTMALDAFVAQILDEIKNKK